MSRTGFTDPEATPQGFSGVATPVENTLVPASSTTLAIVANRAYLTRFVPRQNFTITTVVNICTIVGVGTTPVDVGLYAVNGNRLGSSGAIAVDYSVLGTKVLTLTAPVPILRGVPYFAAYSCGALGGTPSLAGVNFTDTTDTVRKLVSANLPDSLWILKSAAHPLPATITANDVSSGGLPILYLT